MTVRRKQLRKYEGSIETEFLKLFDFQILKSHRSSEALTILMYLKKIIFKRS